MTYSDYSLNPQEFLEYITKGSTPKLQKIWEDLIRRIEDDSLKNEAKKKDIDLIDNPDMEDDNIASYKVISVRNGSDKLNEYITDILYPNIVCLKS